MNALARALAAEALKLRGTLALWMCVVAPGLVVGIYVLQILTRFHASRGQLDKADEALQAALRINPAYATALENLGDVRVRQASEAYQRARQLDGANARLAPKIEALRGALAGAAKPGG